MFIQSSDVLSISLITPKCHSHSSQVHACVSRPINIRPSHSKAKHGLSDGGKGSNLTVCNRIGTVNFQLLPRSISWTLLLASSTDNPCPGIFQCSFDLRCFFRLCCCLNTRSVLQSGNGHFLFPQRAFLWLSGIYSLILLDASLCVNFKC